jgi:hypothetical protein
MSGFIFPKTQKTTVTQVLTNSFGTTFLKATTDQKLALIECSAFLMRQGNYSLREAISIVTPEVVMPPPVRLCSLRLDGFSEGLTLLALLYGGVNRDCGNNEE